MIDNQSPPGSWKEELDRAPWGYGQHHDKGMAFALAKIRQAGLWHEAALLHQRIVSLEAEIERMTE